MVRFMYVPRNGMTPAMVRPSRRDSEEGKRLLRRLERAQRAFQDAERRRDQLVREALAGQVGVRAVAAALGVDKATISRRYGRKESA